MEEKKEEIVEDVKEDVKSEPDKKEKKKGGKKKGVLIALGVYLLAMLVVVGVILFQNRDKLGGEGGSISKSSNKYKSELRMTGNSVEKFDLSFLQSLYENKNMIYSPLSIKYALLMLSEGAKGDTKAQIDAIIGDYKPNKYNNNDNMSFANAMFIRESYKDVVLPSYTDTLKEKFNADIVYDSFDNASTINNWVSDKTFKLINGILDDDTVKGLDYSLVNALAIDMNWNYCIQPASGAKIPYMDYKASYVHEDFSDYVSKIYDNHYESMDFNGNNNTKSVVFAATINNYDIIKDKGEDNIRKTVGDDYDEFLANGGCGNDPDRETYLNQYIKEIKSNYKKTDLSTDFYMEDNDEIKVFAKDLQEYAGTTLQYVGIMPKDGNLEKYVKELTPEKVNKIIKDMKEIKSENFEEGTIINIKGSIPLFKYDFEFDLMESLKNLGVKDVFDHSKADLTNMLNTKGSAIVVAKHKSTIEFSNEGIKAAAATAMGGAGAAGCVYDYIYKVPVKKIDMSFDKPYLYLIRDKNSGEVWFIGQVFDAETN